MACGNPGGTNYAGTWTASATGVTALSESFFWPLVAVDQKASLAGLSSQICPFRHLEGSLAWGPSLLFGMSGTLEGPPWLGSYSSSAHQSLKEPWVGSYSVVQCIRH